MWSREEERLAVTPTQQLLPVAGACVSTLITSLEQAFLLALVLPVLHGPDEDSQMGSAALSLYFVYFQVFRSHRNWGILGGCGKKSRPDTV